MINRREFIKLGLVASAGILAKSKPRLNSPGVATGLVRVGSHEVSVYSMPSDESIILYQHYRDDVIHTYYPVTSEYPLTLTEDGTVSGEGIFIVHTSNRFDIGPIHLLQLSQNRVFLLKLPSLIHRPCGRMRAGIGKKCIVCIISPPIG